MIGDMSAVGDVPDRPRLSFPHPLVDSQGDGSFRTESRASLLHLSAGRADLLVTARAAGKRALIVTDSLSRLTEPLVALLRETGGTWVIREADGGFSDGLSGRRLERFDAEPAAVSSPNDLSERYLAPSPRPWVRVRAVVARRHRAEPGTRLGGDLEALAHAFTGQAPAGWGLHEPAGLLWNRDDLTTFAREAMPNATRSVAVGGAGRPLFASLVTHRTTKGVEEITEVVAAMGAAGSDATAEAVASIPQTLASLAEGMPLMGLAFVDAGSRDLTRSPVAPGPSTPAALLVGAPGVRLLGLDPADAEARFGATLVGRRRLPALVFPFTQRPVDGRWSALRDVLSAVGHDRLTDALGRDTTRLLRLDDEPEIGPR